MAGDVDMPYYLMMEMALLMKTRSDVGKASLDPSLR